MIARICSFVLLSLAMAATACGTKPKGKGGSSPTLGVLEAAFSSAAAKYNVPVRYMMATGYLESRLSAKNAQANYVSVTSPDKPVARGTLLTETAFGLTFETLGLDGKKAQSQLLETQIEAYAAWIRGNLDAAGVALTSNPQTAEDKFYWIENLSVLHRKGLAQRRNVQIIFARELIEILNAGFIWQDADTGEKLELEPESTPIQVTDFPVNGQNWFTLNQLEGQIYIASYLPLVTVPTGETENKPRRVEVIHCPLSLSACLELQTRNEESDVHLAAHYVIPQDREVFNRVIQVADHKEVIVLTNRKGDNVNVDDAIVVMLAGNSGRNVLGQRQPAIPTWFSDTQLRSMAQVVNDVCTLMSQKTPDLVKREECMAPEGEKGVRFWHQGTSEELRWGDIADFDPTIFEAYLRNPGGLNAEVAFEFYKGNREFDAGEEIDLNVLFPSNARVLELERLNRCRDGRVIWEPVRTQQVRSETKTTFYEILHDSGPNRNGEQYFRMRVYGADGRLAGWSIDHVYLSGFEAETAFASSKFCD